MSALSSRDEIAAAGAAAVQGFPPIPEPIAVKVRGLLSLPVAVPPVAATGTHLDRRAS